MHIKFLVVLALVFFSNGSQSSSDDCGQALGMESQAIKNSQIFGGSAFNNDHSKYGSHNARLHDSLGYRADPSVDLLSNVLGIDLKGYMIITAVATQGFGDPRVSEWVRSYHVFYNNTVGQRRPVENIDGKALDFPGNTDSNSVKRNEFPIPVLASSVYFVPLRVKNNAGLRLELYGCKGGHYFIVWLMLKQKIFSVEYTDPSSSQYQDAVTITINAVNGLLRTTWGFLYARVREMSPQRSPDYSTLVTAIVEIYCVRSSEQHLLTKLKSAIEKEGTIFEPEYMKSQYPNRCGCAPPRVGLNLSKTLDKAEEVWISKRFSKTIDVHHSCPPKEKVFYEWRLSKIDDETGYFGPFLEIVEKKRLLLPLKIIGVGYVYVQCVVEIRGDAASMSFDYGFLRIVLPALKAIITDMTNESESRDIIRLSAEKSFDAGQPSKGSLGLNFSWFCRLEGEIFSVHSTNPVVDIAVGRDKSHGGCFGFGPGVLSCKDKVLQLNRTEMVTSRDYIFQLLVDKDERNASAVYEFNAMPQVSLSVRCLSNCGKKVSPQDGLRLEASCQGEECTDISHYTWSLYLLNKTASESSFREVYNITIQDTSQVVIHDIFKLQDDTARNISYVCKVAVNVQGLIRIDADYSFVVNSPPERLTSEASCDVRPMEGEAIFTDFFITCWGWYDEDHPLNYEFRYRDEYGMVLIQSGNLYNVSAKLPIGDPAKDYILGLEALVGDSFKDFSTTKLFVKVRPPKRSNLSDTVVDQQLNFIRDFVKVEDSDQATELAFIMMSTVKSLGGEMFDRKAGDILNDMKGLKVTSPVHVTKVAAVIVLATENKNKLPLTSQVSALTLLEEATSFMTSQYSLESTYDQRLAQIVSYILLNGLGSLLQISSREARLETKDELRQAFSKNVSIKMIQLVRNVGKFLSSLRQTQKTIVQSNYMDIMIYNNYKPENLGGKKISNGGTSVFLPESIKAIFVNTNERLSLQLIAFKDNPYTWDPSSSNIHSKVIDITLRTSRGKVVEVANLKHPIELQIPHKQKMGQSTFKNPRHSFLKPGVFQYHTVVIPSKEYAVSLKIATMEGRRLTVYLGREFKPNATNYTSMFSLPDFSSCQKSKSKEKRSCSFDPHTVKLVSNDSGLYFVGIKLVDVQDLSNTMLRRSCTENNKRRKRSCVQIKDSPTTPPPTANIIRPQYNARTDINYTFLVTMGTCLYWSEEENKWSTSGCKLGSDSVHGRVQCYCNHLTSFGGDFFVAPNPIDFEKVWTEFSRLGESGNYVVLATVCSMFGVYVVGLMFARRSDKSDERKIIPEFDLSKPLGESCTYAITIQTGAWRNSGTTANVGMVLYGEDDVSKPIVFTHGNLSRIFFARGSVNTFKVALEKSLGSLFKLRVWHDNSGDSPSWFLKEIVIEDVQTREKWHFISNRWIAVEKGDGEIEVELRVASADDISKFKNVLYSRTQKAFGDSHLWVSLFTKPPQDQFTRCQRLSCCLSIIFCAMVTGAMFYRFGAKATDVFHVGPLTMSWTEIKIGIQSGLVAVPVNILIVTIFKNIKQTEGQLLPTGCLPYFFIYIAWGLCLTAMLISALFTIFYSLSWGAKISNQWLVSMTFSVFEDLLLIQPIKVLFIVCLLSVILRKPLDIEKVHGSQLHVPGHPTQGSENGKGEVRILQMEELENARRRRKKEIKSIRVLVEIFFFIIFITLFVVVCYGNRDSVRYSLTASVRDVFGNFSKVTGAASFWSWMRDTFVPGLYNTTWYNGLPFNYDEGFISNRENFLVGMPRLRQVRIRPEMPCEITNQERSLGIARCLPFYSNEHQENSPYNMPGWVPVHNVSSILNLDSLCPKPWQHLTARELTTGPVHGQMATYDGGGYVANLGYNSKSALGVIQSLEQGHWIDDKTVAVVVECTVFEPSTSLFSVVNYLYERYPTGGVITSSRVKTITVYLPQGSSSYRVFYQVCQVVLTFVILTFAITEIVKALRGARAYFTRFWSWVEIILISFATASVAIMLYKDKYTRAYVKNIRANPFDSWSADQIVFWSEIEDFLLACVMFIITVKFLRLIRFNHHIYEMRRTLKDSFAPLCSFSAVFCVIMLAFSSFGYMAFGTSVIEYSSLLNAVRSLLKMLIGGKSSYYQLKVASESSLGPIFLFVYLITALALLLNVFVAILDESYSVSRGEPAKDMNEVDYNDIFLYAWSRAKSALYYLYSFPVFFRESFRSEQSIHKYQRRSFKRNENDAESYAPRLASMDSLHEIQFPRESPERADEMISEVVIYVGRYFDGTDQEDAEVTDEYHEMSYCAPDLDSHSEYNCFLEGDLLRSPVPSLRFDDNFDFDELSLESYV